MTRRAMQGLWLIEAVALLGQALGAVRTWLGDGLRCPVCGEVYLGDLSEHDYYEHAHDPSRGQKP